MSVDDLSPLFSNEVLSSINHDDLIAELLEVYHNDFLNKKIEVNGRSLKVNHNPSQLTGYKGLPESFVHIITRELKSQADRFLDQCRANRIHWIKPILLNQKHKDVIYFKVMDNRGICREYFWLIHKAFMVVLKPISKELQIVTAFCVDNDERLKYFEQFKKYEAGESGCPK